MGRKVYIVLFGLLLIGFLGCAQRYSAEDRTPRMTKEEVRAIMDRPETVIVDARTGSAWRASNRKIKGAVREDPDIPGTWFGKYPQDKVLIFYCA